MERKENFWKEIDSIDDKKTYAIFLCTKCNITKQKILKYNVETNKTTKCLKCYKDRKTYRGVETYYFNKIKARALKKKQAFNITFNSIIDLFYNQKEKCALSGLPLVIRKSKKDKEITASLDRKDSLKGYTIDNVQWVHKDINKLKSNFTEQKFKLLCKLVSIHKSSFSTTT